MSQWLRCIAVAMMAIIPAAALAAAEPLAVTIQSSTNRGDSETGVVVVSVTNLSGRPLLILMADSALLTDSDHLLNDVMTVAASDGSIVAYKGRASRPSVGDRGAYLTLEPGERKSSLVDLPANYAVEGGSYTVSYVQRYIEEAEFSPEGAMAHEVRSNPLVFYVNANLIQGKRSLQAPSSAMAARGRHCISHGHQAISADRAMVCPGALEDGSRSPDREGCR